MPAPGMASKKLLVTVVASFGGFPLYTPELVKFPFNVRTLLLLKVP